MNLSTLKLKLIFTVLLISGGVNSLALAALSMDSRWEGTAEFQSGLKEGSDEPLYLIPSRGDGQVQLILPCCKSKIGFIPKGFNPGAIRLLLPRDQDLGDFEVTVVNPGGAGSLLVHVSHRKGQLQARFYGNSKDFYAGEIRPSDQEIITSSLTILPESTGFNFMATHEYALYRIPIQKTDYGNVVTFSPTVGGYLQLNIYQLEEKKRLPITDENYRFPLRLNSAWMAPVTAGFRVESSLGRRGGYFSSLSVMGGFQVQSKHLRGGDVVPSLFVRWAFHPQKKRQGFRASVP